MKKLLFIFLVLSIFTQALVAGSLSGKDREAVNRALEAKLYCWDYSKYIEQSSFLDQELETISSTKGISEEALLICRNTIEIQKLSLQAITFLKDDSSKKKEALETAKKCIEEYKNFASTHSDLSPQFIFHQMEAELAVVSFQSKARQLAKATSLMGRYKEIYNMDSNFGENLLAYGMLLYLTPKISGGNKELGTSLIQQAATKGSTNYEKVNALILYSQILYEQNRIEEANAIIFKAKELAPNNKMLILVQAMNKAGSPAINTKFF